MSFPSRQITKLRLRPLPDSSSANCGGKVVLLPQCWGPTPGEDDRRTARRIAGLVADLGEAVIAVDDPVPPDLLKAVFGQLDLLVGTRMHSNIFALVQGVPVIPIGYLHKTRGIAQAAGIEEWVIDIHEINDQKLIQKISELWANRERVRLHLEEVMPKLIQESHQAGEILAQISPASPRVGKMPERLRVVEMVLFL